MAISYLQYISSAIQIWNFLIHPQVEKVFELGTVWTQKFPLSYYLIFIYKFYNVYTIILLGNLVNARFNLNAQQQTRWCGFGALDLLPRDINYYRFVLFSESYQDSIAAILPFFHIFGFSTCMLISIFRGVKLMTQPTFIPDKFVELLRNHKITYLMVAPPLGKHMKKSFIFWLTT